MADFTFRDTLITFLRTNLIVTPDSSNTPKVIKFGNTPTSDTTANTSASSGTWTVYKPHYSDFPSAASFVDDIAIMRVTYECSKQITEATFLNAVEDAQQQFRENNESVSRTHRIVMTGDIDELIRFADMLVTMTKYAVSSAT